RPAALRRALGVGGAGAAGTGAGLGRIAYAARRAPHLAVAPELAGGRAARTRGPVDAAALVALLAARTLDDAVAAERDERDGDEVSVVGLGSTPDPRIVA